MPIDGRFIASFIVNYELFLSIIHNLDGSGIRLTLTPLMKLEEIVAAPGAPGVEDIDPVPLFAIW